MNFARQQFQKSRFPGAIGPENGDVFTLLESPVRSRLRGCPHYS
jgi:hypothetical protein